MTKPAAFGLGLAVGAWIFPLTQILTNAAAGRGLLYPKDDR